MEYLITILLFVASIVFAATAPQPQAPASWELVAAAEPIPQMPAPWTPPAPLEDPITIRTTGVNTLRTFKATDNTVMTFNVEAGDCWRIEANDARGQHYEARNLAGCDTTRRLYLPWIEEGGQYPHG